MEHPEVVHRSPSYKTLKTDKSGITCAKFLENLIAVVNDGHSLPKTSTTSRLSLLCDSAESSSFGGSEARCADAKPAQKPPQPQDKLSAASPKAVSSKKVSADSDSDKSSFHLLKKRLKQRWKDHKTGFPSPPVTHGYAELMKRVNKKRNNTL